MKIHKIEQKTDEWFDLRKGKMTASNAQAIGNIGKGLETYIYQLLAEKYSSCSDEGYTNKDMERGNELEEYARDIYEMETGNIVEQVGFVEMDEYSGCSPDGLIDKDGGVEIKCPNDTNHFKLILGLPIDPKYVWQIQMNLLITKRKWWDFVSYNPNFKKSLVIIKFTPDKEKQDKILEGLKQGVIMINELEKKIK